MIEKKYFAELLGTFIFSLGINMSTVFTDDMETANLFQILSCLFCGITITRNISGGHLNAGVSFAFCADEYIKKGNNTLNNKDSTMDLKTFLMYFLYQTIGSFLACTLSWLVYAGHILSFNNSMYSLKGILIAEVFATFIFTYNILIQTNNRFSPNKTISTLLIVFGLYTAVNVTSVLSAGCVNPSLAVGHFLAKHLLAKPLTDQDLSQFVFYVVSGFIGSLLAALVYNNYFIVEVDQEHLNEAKHIQDNRGNNKDEM